jgi:hypothetical protein
MATLNGKINLLKYPGAKKIIANGVKGIFIPAEQNPSIFIGEKGAYAAVRVVEKVTTFNDKTYSHFIAATLSKAQRDELAAQGLSEDEIKAFSPILGNLETYEPQGATYEEATVAEDVDDLPFD